MARTKSLFSEYDAMGIFKSDDQKIKIAYKLYGIINYNYKSIESFSIDKGINKKTLYNIFNRKNYTIDQLIEVCKGADLEVLVDHKT